VGATALMVIEMETVPGGRRTKPARLSSSFYTDGHTPPVKQNAPRSPSIADVSSHQAGSMTWVGY
jgi:hypothetical protein